MAIRPTTVPIAILARLEKADLTMATTRLQLVPIEKEVARKTSPCEGAKLCVKCRGESRHIRLDALGIHRRRRGGVFTAVFTIGVEGWMISLFTIEDD